MACLKAWLNKIATCSCIRPFLQHVGVLAELVQSTVENVTARTLCEMGDSLIVEETSKVYKNKKDMKKGEIINVASIVLQVEPTSQTNKL